MTPQWLRLIVAACCSGLCACVIANDGEYAGLRFQIDVSAGDDFGARMHIQPDGKLMLVGTCFAPGSTFCAARLNPDGTYDPTFGPSGLGYETISGNSFPPNTTANAFVLAPDGGSVIVGNYSGASFALGMLARTQADGSLKTGGSLPGWNITSFSGVPTTPSSTFRAVALQSDGKIVVAGSAKRDDTGNIDFGVARFNADLTLDASFNGGQPKLVAFDLGGPSGEVGDNASSVVIQPDGKILVGGYSYGTDTIHPTLARLFSNGSLDTSFGTGGKAVFNWGVGGEVVAMTLDRDGSILVAGVGIPTLTGSNDFVISRVTANGTLDTQFGKGCVFPACPPGPVFIDFPYATASSDIPNALTVQSDGKILIAGEAPRSGSSGGGYFAVARVDENGILDPTFGSGGLSGGIIGPEPGVTDELYSIEVGNHGIMIAGTTYDAAEGKYRFGIGRLSLDLVFSSHFEMRH